jgi:hypothetical protein
MYGRKLRYALPRESNYRKGFSELCENHILTEFTTKTFTSSSSGTY